MLAVVGQIFAFIFQQFDYTWAMYTVAPIIPAFFVLWILDRVFNIFQVLKR